MGRRLELGNRQFLLDGKPFRIIAGAMHYFRIHPDLWADRISKAAAMGLNAIETYVCWNLHEVTPGKFDFSGILDIERYIQEIQKQGLYVIVRPGPYICAEWEGGALPGWLGAIPGIEYRCFNKPYLDAVERFFDELLPRLKKLTLAEGGPILAMQIENEYGSYCGDKEYLRYLKGIYERHGVDCLYFTSDGPDGHFLQGGQLDGVLSTINFGTDAEHAFELVRSLRPNEPDMCGEFWDGWFEHWGTQRHHRSAGMEEGGAGRELDTMLKNGASINIYMFHGGTNFGFTNGANGNSYVDYEADITSYDYDAPLTECGDPGEKFWAFQKIIQKYTPENKRIRPIQPTEKCSFEVELTASRRLLDCLDELGETRGHATIPPTMDALGQTFGFIHYRRTMKGPLPKTNLRLFRVNDYAQVYWNGQLLCSKMRDNGKDPVAKIEIPPEGATMDILVENCGRINYGPYTGRDPKGIVDCVCLELQRLMEWDYTTLPLNAPPQEGYGPLALETTGAIFHKAEFTLDKTADTFLLNPGKKGLVWVNGFNLGRYWDIGPQETLYIPAPVLRKGKNTVVVLELERLASPKLLFLDAPRLG